MYFRSQITAICEKQSKFVIDLGVNVIRSCPHYWLITRFVTRVPRRCHVWSRVCLPFRNSWVHPPDVSGLRVMLDLWLSYNLMLYSEKKNSRFAWQKKINILTRVVRKKSLISHVSVQTLDTVRMIPSKKCRQYPVFGLHFFEGIIRTVSSVWTLTWLIRDFFRTTRVRI
jgi:hypothetical protein